jgi:hypothetical protein
MPKTPKLAGPYDKKPRTPEVGSTKQTVLVGAVSLGLVGAPAAHPNGKDAPPVQGPRLAGPGRRRRTSYP